jgi:dolichol-phosphate mannosyltransferase
MRSFAARRPGVYVATLSNNVGYQRALECGLRTAKGDLLVVIDADCEDPPEMIRDFLAEQEKGFDVVYGERVDRAEGALMKGLRRLFYRVTRALGDDEVVLDMAEFALITSAVRDAMVADANSFPFFRASIGRVGFRRVGLPYKRQSRVAGQTHYNLFRMTTFAVAGILSSTTLFLRLPIYLLPFWILAVAGLGASYLSSGSRASAVMLLVLICGYFGATAAFIAVYIARIYKNSLGRPNYVIDRKLSSLQP